MPIPQSITDLNENPNNNSPQGSEAVGPNANGYIQALSAFIRQLYDNKVGKGSLDAPVGTRLVMQQASAPTGWEVDTATWLTDCSLRFNSGGGHGGTVGWSTWNFGGTVNVNGHSLSINELPAHSHGVNDPWHAHGVNDPGHAHGVNDPGHSHPMGGGAPLTNPGTVLRLTTADANSTVTNSTGGAGTNISIRSGQTGIGIAGSPTGITIQNTGSGAAHGHTITTPQVKYADCIVAVKK